MFEFYGGAMELFWNVLGCWVHGHLP